MFLACIRLGLSPLRKHKFDHHFDDTPNADCIANDGIENTEHYLLLCKSFKDIRATLIQNVTDILIKLD